MTLKTEFTPDGTKEGGGTLKLFVNGKPAGEGKMKRSAFRHGLEPFEVGRDSITPVSPGLQDAVHLHRRDQGCHNPIAVISAMKSAHFVTVVRYRPP